MLQFWPFETSFAAVENYLEMFDDTLALADNCNAA